MGNVIRINEGSATSAIKTLAGKVSVTESARQKVSSATSKIKWDDIFSIGHYSGSIYNGLDEAKKELKNLSSMMESVTNTSQSAIKAFSSVDGSGKAKSSKKKKKDWGKIFKNLGIYSGIVTAGTLVAGSAGYFIAQDVFARVIGGKNTKNRSDSVTTVNPSQKNSINQKKIEEKGKAVNSSYNEVKAEHNEMISKYYGKGNLESYSYNGEDCLTVKNSQKYTGSEWDQSIDHGNNESIACPGFSEAAYHNMVDDSNYSYMDYWSGSSWKDNANGKNVIRLAEGHNAVMDKAYERLNDGQPSIVSVNSIGKGEDWHYVVVTGIKKSAIQKKNSGGSLEMNDFIIYDPWNGTTRTLDRAGNHSDNTACSKLWG